MFAYTVFCNDDKLFETNDRAEAYEFFETCKSDTAEKFERMASEGGLKEARTLKYKIFQWGENLDPFECVEAAFFYPQLWE